jgi:serine/threonine protein kinase
MNNSPELLSKSQLYTLKGEIVAEVETDTGGGALEKPTDSRQLENVIIDQKYKVICLLGEGGMGAVYKAHHLMLDKEVALKTFRTPNLTSDAWARFQREAQAIARLTHQNIVQVFDFGVSEDNVPYYTMECLVGESLADRLEAKGELALDEAARIFIQVCRGLSLAHSKGIIHRDLKPANIFLVKGTSTSGPTDIVKVVDFGIAGLASNSLESQKLTATGTIFGSPFYMSPEQSLGEEVTAQSDIYSCGCAFFEAITGSPPFFGNTAFATMLKHQQSPIPRLSDVTEGRQFPQRVTGLIDRMLAKNKEARFQSFEEVASELEEICKLKVDGRGRQASAASAQDSDDLPLTEQDKLFGSRSKAKPLLLAAGAILLLSLTVAALVIPGQLHSNNPKTSKANGNDASVMDVGGTLTTNTAANKIDTKVPTNRHIVKPYLQNPGGNFDLEPRRFLFIAPQSLGVLHWRPRPGAGSAAPGAQDARGIVLVPPHSILQLDAGQALFDDPQWFDGFGPNDLVELELLRDFEWGKDHWAHLSRLTGIRFLCLDSAEFKDDFVDDLNKLTKINILSLKDTDLTGHGLARVKRLPQIVHLDISHIHTFPVALPLLATSRALVNLELNDCSLTDTDLKVISSLSTLRSLDIRDNRSVTDIGIAALGRLQNLIFLNLHGVRVSPACIKPLAKLTALANLDIDCAKWSPDDQRRLKAAFPTCNITASDGVNPIDIGDVKSGGR